MSSYLTNIGKMWFLSVSVANAAAGESRAFSSTTDIGNGALHIIFIKDGWGGFATPDPTLVYSSQIGAFAMDPAAGTSGYSDNNILWSYASWTQNYSGGANTATLSPTTAPTITTGSNFGGGGTHNLAGFAFCSHSSVAASASKIIGIFQFDDVYPVGSAAKVVLNGIATTIT